jgi:hypothetical protein
VAALRSALLGVATPERVRGLAERLFVMAENGDVPACKLLLSYLIGKPVEVVDPDTLDQAEAARLMASPDTREVLSAARDRLPAEAAVRLLGDLLEGVPRRLAAMLAETQRNPPPPPLTEARFRELLAEARRDPGTYTVNVRGRAAENIDRTLEEICP